MRFLTSLKYLILMAKILGVGLANLGGWFGHCEFFSHEIVKFYSRVKKMSCMLLCLYLLL